MKENNADIKAKEILENTIETLEKLIEPITHRRFTTVDLIWGSLCSINNTTNIDPDALHDLLSLLVDFEHAVYKNKKRLPANSVSLKISKKG